MNGPSRSGPFFIWKSDLILWRTGTIGASPSGKAADFGSAIRRFESYRPSHHLQVRRVRASVSPSQSRKRSDDHPRSARNRR